MKHIFEGATAVCYMRLEAKANTDKPEDTINIADKQTRRDNRQQTTEPALTPVLLLSRTERRALYINNLEKPTVRSIRSKASNVRLLLVVGMWRHQAKTRLQKNQPKRGGVQWFSDSVVSTCLARCQPPSRPEPPPWGRKAATCEPLPPPPLTPNLPRPQRQRRRREKSP